MIISLVKGDHSSSESGADLVIITMIVELAFFICFCSW